MIIWGKKKTKRTRILTAVIFWRVGLCLFFPYFTCFCTLLFQQYLSVTFIIRIKKDLYFEGKRCLRKLIYEISLYCSYVFFLFVCFKIYCTELNSIGLD